jgi:hypothetical protein
MEDRPPDQGSLYWIVLGGVLTTLALLVIAAAIYRFA